MIPCLKGGVPTEPGTTISFLYLILGLGIAFAIGSTRQLLEKTTIGDSVGVLVGIGLIAISVYRLSGYSQGQLTFGFMVFVFTMVFLTFIELLDKLSENSQEP